MSERDGAVEQVPDEAVVSGTAHFPGLPVVFELPDRPLLLGRQRCAWCGVVLLEVDVPKPSALVLPSQQQQPVFQSLPQLWLVYDQATQDVTFWHEGTRPEQACVFQTTTEEESDAGPAQDT